jgi:Beta propeller domain
MLMRAVLAAVVVVALAAPAAVADEGAGAPQKPRAAKVRLKAFESCTGLVRYARRNALRTARSMVWLRGGGRDDGPLPPPQSGVGEDGAGRGGQEEDFSRTNVQEAGVDEPDIVKTDGSRLFVLARGVLHAVDARAATPRRIGSLELGGDYGHELLLRGDRALVIFLRGADTHIAEVDVSDPAAMRVRRTLVVDGWYLSARQTGATARVVIRSNPGVSLASEQSIRRARLARWMPRAVLRRRGPDRRGRLLACRSVRRTASFTGLDMVSVVTIDLDRGLPEVDADALMTDAETVYASTGSLYMATHRWLSPTAFAEGPPERLHTAIHRFDASQPGQTTYRSSGEVRGFLHSQWALSEHEGHLRVASTEAPEWWGTPGTESESRVTVLREQGGRLAEVGRVGGLGRGERIFAVRFIGERGYVVTFRQVDPLYTLDLADPAAPKVLGELKILGYSAYLHPVGDGLLLGVGQDGTPEGRLLGTQLSLFDVSNARRPRLLHSRPLGEGSSSDVEFEHRAFLYWPATGLTVVPLQRWEETRADIGLHSEAVSFRVNTNGIAPLGRVSHPGEAWESRITRSVVVGERLFTISELGVMASPLAAPQGGAWLAF